MKLSRLLSRFKNQRNGQLEDRVGSVFTLDEVAPERTPIASCVERTECTIAGTITSLEILDACEPHALQAVLEDDSEASLRLIWLGREAIPGLGIGVVVRAVGTVATKCNSRVMIDPSYTILNRG